MSGRLKQNQITWRLVAAAAALACGVPAQAETPLSLTVSQELTYDSNILRDNARKYRDAVSSTGVQVGFNKQYGRQSYTASATAVAKRYKNTKEYDNEGYNINLGLSSSMLSNLFGSIDFSAVKQQQSPEDQGNLRYNETIDSQNVKLFLQYGMYGRWSVNTTYSFSKADYSVFEIYNRDAKNLRLGVRYSPTDLLYFDVGYQKSKIENPNYPLLASNDVIIFGDPVDRQDLDLSTRWVVTGFSNLSGRIAYTREKHSRDPRRDFNGLTGNVAWDYTPGGKMSYRVVLDRDTNNSGGSTYRTLVDLGFGTASTTGFLAQNRVSTGLNLSATWQATAKISVTSGLNYRRIQEESTNRVPGLGTNVGSSLSGSYKSVRMGLKYALARSTSMGCSVERYNRSRSLFSREYDGESVDCNLIFTLD